MTYSHRKRIEQALIEAGRRLDDLGLVPARDGNVSGRIAPDRVLITATGVRKRSITPEQLITVDLEGRVQGRGRASTELGMHLAIYRQRPDVQAVVHAHPPVAVGFACAGIGLTDCLMPEVVVNLGSVPLTPYATPGTDELERSILSVLPDHDAFLLANHGAVTMGDTVDQALERMETLEHFARIALVSRLLGGGNVLPPSATLPLGSIRERAGNPRPVTCVPGPGLPAAGAVGSGSSNLGDLPGTPESPLPPLLAEAVAEAIRTVLGSRPRR